MPIDEPIGRQLRALAAQRDTGDWLTVTLDVSAGAAVAMSALRSMIPLALGGVHWDTDTTIASLLDHVEAAIDEALAVGDHGLLIVAEGEAVALQGHTPLPFRNTVHRGEHPWIFEYERMHALTHRPVIVVQMDRQDIDVLRIQHQHTVDNAHERREEGTNPSRTGQSGRARAAQGYAGGHSRHRIERSIAAHRTQFADAGAQLVADTAGPDDLLILAGPPETRGLLHQALPQTLQERVVSEHGIDPEAPEQARVHEAILAAMTVHYAETDRLAQELLDGGHGARGLRGPESAARAVREGRLETLVLHEDAVAHFGHAADARPHDPPEHEQLVDRLLHDALEQGAALRIARLPELLPQHAGVAGLARW